MMDNTTGVKLKVYPEGRGAGETDPERRGAGKTDPGGRGAGRTHPRREVVFGLAAIMLLVTCAVAAGGLLAYFRGKDGRRRFTIRAWVGGQILREEVEFDPQSGTAVYRDVSGAGEGEIIQTRQGLTVLYRRGGCYLLENSKNRTRELDMDAAEATMEALAAHPVSRLVASRVVVFVNKSVPIGAEDDVSLRPELPPMCGDAQLYRVQVADAPDVEVWDISVGERVETRRTKRKSVFFSNLFPHLTSIEAISCRDVAPSSLSSCEHEMTVLDGSSTSG